MRLPGKGMSWKEFGKGVYEEFSRDNVTDLAATVTYYGVLSLFPCVLFLVALASLFITPSDAEGIVNQLASLAPGPATQIIGARIQQLAQGQSVTLCPCASCWIRAPMISVAAGGATCESCFTIPSASAGVMKRPASATRKSTNGKSASTP